MNEINATVNEEHINELLTSDFGEQDLEKYMKDIMDGTQWCTTFEEEFNRLNADRKYYNKFRNTMLNVNDPTPTPTPKESIKNLPSNREPSHKEESVHNKSAQSKQIFESMNNIPDNKSSSNRNNSNSNRPVIEDMPIPNVEHVPVSAQQVQVSDERQKSLSQKEVSAEITPSKMVSYPEITPNRNVSSNVNNTHQNEVSSRVNNTNQQVIEPDYSKRSSSHLVNQPESKKSLNEIPEDVPVMVAVSNSNMGNSDLHNKDISKNQSNLSEVRVSKNMSKPPLSGSMKRSAENNPLNQNNLSNVNMQKKSYSNIEMGQQAHITENSSQRERISNQSSYEKNNQSSINQNNQSSYDQPFQKREKMNEME